MTYLGALPAPVSKDPTVVNNYILYAFRAVTNNCRWKTTRTAPAKGTTPAQTQTIEFIVWPTEVPETKGTLIDLDKTTQTVWEFPVNSQYTLRISEKANPQGYVWKEPTVVPKCGTAVRDGRFQTGYVQYFLSTGAKDCTEKFTIFRPDWWTAKPTSVDITVKVGKGGSVTPTCYAGATYSETVKECVCKDGKKYTSIKTGTT